LGNCATPPVNKKVVTPGGKKGTFMDAARATHKSVEKEKGPRGIRGKSRVTLKTKENKGREKQQQEGSEGKREDF